MRTDSILEKSLNFGELVATACRDLSNGGDYDVIYAGLKKRLRGDRLADAKTWLDRYRNA